MSSLTPMMRQYMSIKEQYKDALLFFRLGDFYELFFEDAIIASKELEITLTSRDCGLSERAPMCGVPHHASENYIAKLIDKGFKVAICEQTQDPSEAKGIVDREVVRVITPGTLLESSMLEDKNNNYLLSYFMENKDIGIAWIDLSTGEFLVTELLEKDAYEKSIDILSGISPKEIILPEDNSDKIIKDININNNSLITLFEDWAYNYNTAYKKLINHFKVNSLEGYGCGDLNIGIRAAGALMEYLSQTQKNALAHITAIKPYYIETTMILDNFTRRNLEISETIRSKSNKGSLLWLIDKTNTPMGGRLLRQWVQQPLLDSKMINERLDSVEELVNNPIVLEHLKDVLNKIYDIERLIGRIGYGNANARDLISLKHSFKVLPSLKEIIKKMNSKLIKSYYNQFDTLEDITALLDSSIEENPPITIREGSIIKDSFDAKLDRYREAMTSGKDWLIALEKDEKEKTGIKNLKIGFNKVFGYYLEVTRSYYDLVPEYYIRKQTLANAERFITPEIKEVEERILEAEDKSMELEYKLFIKIRTDIATQVKRIQKTAQIISNLDVLYSLARIAIENRYVRPIVDDGDIINIHDGRHPVIEKTLSNDLFVPNHTFLDNGDNQIAIITGPNMAGKSTYMRQVALIVLMAQMGSYVPASEAHIGLVDRIFTRVGASDDLSSGQSTFMVEMNEMAYIIHNASKKSLLILDEIGRGTSTFDGLSIAWSIIEFISNKSKLGAKTLFATHYHELTELEGKLSGVKNYKILVKEQSNDIIFLRKIIRGSAEKSLGVQVARLAGLPAPIINRAQKILNKLEETDIANKQIDSIVSENSQISFFNQNLTRLEEELKDIDVLNITPMEAIKILDELINKINR